MSTTPRTVLQRLRDKALSQTHYGGATADAPATLTASDCPHCGAGRAKHAGVTHCAFCGEAFLSVSLDDGLHLKRSDNSAT